MNEITPIQTNQIPPNLSLERDDVDAVDFKKFFESLSVMFYIVSTKGEKRVTYLSPAFESLGYPVEHWYGEGKKTIFHQIMHPEDYKMILEENEKVDRVAGETDYEYRIYTRSGEMRWWKDFSRPHYDERGEMDKWVGMIYDITDQKLASEELGKANKKLESSAAKLSSAYNLVEDILRSMADPVIAVDDHGYIERVNQATIDTLGYSADELKGQPIGIITGTETYLSDEEFNQLLREARLVGLEKDVVRKDGTTLRVAISTSLLKGRNTAAVIVAKDISSRIEYERQMRQYARKLERTNIELQDFAYVASHDLQEPLRKIQAFGDRLQTKHSEALGEQGNDYIERMRDSASRMQRLINDLLSFSRVNSKAKPFETVDMNVIMSEIASDLEIRTEQTNGRIEIGELPTIDADPVQMRQLFQNLVGNSLKFHRKDVSPVVKISAEVFEELDSLADSGLDKDFVGSARNVCQITVSDNGIGFEEKYLDRIFTVFQRLHGRSEYEGSGIGLAVCRKIADRHEGTVHAESKLNEGSMFFVTLPIKQLSKEK